MRLPGRWLRAAAARVCATRTMDRVIDPVVADVHAEYAEAMRTGRRWRAAWIGARGYAAFWKAVGLHTLHSGPRWFWDVVAANRWTLGRMMGCSLLAFVGVTLLLTAPPMMDVRISFGLKPALLLLPQAVPLSIPIALALGIVFAVPGPRPAALPIRPVLLVAGAATILAFVAMLILPVTNQAFRVAAAEKLNLRGVTKYSLPRGPNELSLSELASRIREYEISGSPATARPFARTYYLRFALPAATFVLSLLALGICGTVRGRALRFLAIVVGVSLYWAGLAFTEGKANLSPLLSVWAPNLVFTAISLALLQVRGDRFEQSQKAQA
jgi:lipopolysaccharide export system permease LptF/LptG-like protein